MTLKPYVRQAGGHQRLQWIGGSEISVLVDSEASGGTFMVIETRAQRGDASPMHVHSTEDELFIVLEGGMTVWVGDERHDLDAGGVAFLPREIPHGYRITSDGTRAFNICTPGGLEGFFREVGHDLLEPPPEGWSISPAVLGQIAAKHGTTIVGPPKGEHD